MNDLVVVVKDPGGVINTCEARVYHPHEQTGERDWFSCNKPAPCKRAGYDVCEDHMTEPFPVPLSTYDTATGRKRGA